MAAEAAVIAEEPPAPDAAPPAPAAEPAKAKGKPEPAKAKGKAEKGKKEKKGAKDATAATGAGDGPSVAAHPRAARAVAQAKSWGALIGFVLGGYLALPTMTLAEAGARALMAGIACYLATWAGAVFVWRRLVVIELKGKEQELAAAHAAALARAQLPSGPPSPTAPSRPG